MYLLLRIWRLQFKDGMVILITLCCLRDSDFANSAFAAIFFAVSLERLTIIAELFQVFALMTADLVRFLRIILKDRLSIWASFKPNVEKA